MHEGCTHTHKHTHTMLKLYLECSHEMHGILCDRRAQLAVRLRRLAAKIVEFSRPFFWLSEIFWGFLIMFFLQL